MHDGSALSSRTSHRFLGYYSEIVSQVVEEIKFNQLVLYETCIEKWSSQRLKVGYAACVLMVQAVIPALVVGLVHAQIAAYLNAHARTQRDSRRAQRELQRNRRTTLLLSGVAVLFAVSWLPLSVFSLLADLCLVSADSLYVTLAACHVMAMTSAVSNPVVYGWLNSNFRRELVQVLPRWCRRPAVESSQEPSPTLLLCQNGQKPQHNNPATTYTAL
ncbi:unnamed protein product [Nezara viridula]|uniref:G-protein coupled receptors family 1 profile domain-containing protein n=1 Tax=Nezara viridula TaxID=85310 RepID=A0A9P0E8S1_NEZVI|nr:unnamed protein product [Nezara viridula]